MGTRNYYSRNSLSPGNEIRMGQRMKLDSAAVSIFVVILVELTNTETAAKTPPTVMQNFQKATNQRGVLSGAFFGGSALPHE